MSLKDHQNPDGNYNGISAMSELTGIKETEVSRIWAEVQANNQKMENCPYHEFEENQGELADRAVNRGKRYVCIHCGGYINPVMYRWHELGRRQKP
ncbi:hypothetical protein fHeYen801_120 [Yersinia phage fHe-Yen8-01]|nr:hypothetical protein fHeYen801_120 [Yersinia phage fHe-Yen8-01]